MMPPLPLTQTDWNNPAIAIPVEADPRDRRLAELRGDLEDATEIIEELRRKNAKMRIFIDNLSKIEAKPVKAEAFCDEAKELLYIGAMQTLATIRAKCKLWLEDHPKERAL